MRIKAIYILLIILAMAITKTALSGESYRGRYKLSYEREGYSGPGHLVITDTTENTILVNLIGEEKVDFYTPFGSWIKAESPCAAIACLDTEYIPPVLTTITRKGDTITHSDFQKYRRIKIYLYYPKTERWELFNDVYTHCDQAIAGIFDISTQNDIFVINDVNNWFYSAHLKRDSDKLASIGSSEIWGPLDNGYLISRNMDPEDWPISLFTTEVVIYNPETFSKDVNTISETSQVVYVVPAGEIIVFDKTRHNKEDSSFTDLIDLGWLESENDETGYLVKSWSIPDLHCDTLGYFHLGYVRGTKGSVMKVHSEPEIEANPLYPRFGYPCSLDYIEVYDTFFLDLEPRVVYDSLGAIAETGIDTFYRHTTMKFDSRLYIDLENEPHLRSRRLGIHEEN